MKIPTILLILTIGSVMSFDLKLYVLPFSDSASGKTDTLFVAVDGVVQQQNLILGSDIPENGLLPVVFEGKNGRQSKLHFIPTYSHTDLAQHHDEGTTVKPEDQVDDEDTGEIKIEDKTPENIVDDNTPDSIEEDPNDKKSKLSERELETNKNSSTVQHDNETHVHNSTHASDDQNDKKTPENDDHVSEVVSTDDHDEDEDTTINEAEMVMNFDIAEENANKIVEHKNALEDLKSVAAANKENFIKKFPDDDLDVHLADFSKVLSLGFYEQGVQYTDFGEEVPGEPEKIIDLNGKQGVVVIVVEKEVDVVETEDQPVDDKDEIEEVGGGGGEDAQKNDFDFFLSLEYQGQKKDGIAFLFIMANEKDFDVQEVEIDNVKAFVEDEDAKIGQILVVFEDDKSKLMSEPVYVNVHNHFDEAKKDTYESIDETKVNLTKEIFKEFKAEEGDSEDKTLNLYEDATEIKVEEDDKVADYIGKAEEAISGEKNILNIKGPNTVIKVTVVDLDENTGSEERKRKIRMLIV